jgi:hypothetical protein
MKLNLGCGTHHLDGYINVDRSPLGEPDVVFDLEKTPWPWLTGSVTEAVFRHSLEHMGGDLNVFFAMIKELYRVCAAGAEVKITVPHPRNDSFLADPTHVRAITPDLLAMFSKRLNRQWQSEGAANTPLALSLDVDFDFVSATQIVEERYLTMLRIGAITQEKFDRIVRERNNVVREYRIELRVAK